MEEERPLALGQTCVDKVNFERTFRQRLKAMILVEKSVTIRDVDSC